MAIPGVKISQMQVVAATKLNLPVWLSVGLRSNMEMLGKRLPYLTKYKASVGENGKISAIGMKIFCCREWKDL